MSTSSPTPADSLDNPDPDSTLVVPRIDGNLTWRSYARARIHTGLWVVRVRRVPAQ